MTTGLSLAAANSFFDAICNATAYSETNLYCKLHIGDPGVAGAGNPATETTRMVVSFGAAAAGAIANDVAFEWVSIAGSQDATEFTLWNHLTLAAASNFVGSGTVTANPYTAGDTFTVPIGDLDLSLTTAVT